MSGMLQNEFYRVRVADYAIPAFCDSEADYYDTAENIRLLYERSLTGRNREEAERWLRDIRLYAGPAQLDDLAEELGLARTGFQQFPGSQAVLIYTK